MRTVNTKIVTILIIGIMVFSATAVFAAKNYNSSKSNTTSIAWVNKQVGDILLRYGAGGSEINKVTDALAVGISDVDLKATLFAIGINEKGAQEVFNELDRLGIAINEEGLQAFSTLDAGDAAQGVIEIAVEKVERGEVPTSVTGDATQGIEELEIAAEQIKIGEVFIPGAEDTPQPEVKAKAILLIKMEDKAISTPDDSFFDIFYELEVFVGVIAKDANITKAEAIKVVDALMEVSPSFAIDENGLQERGSEELFGAYNFLLAVHGSTLTEPAAKRALDAFVNATAKSLRGGNRVALVGFGSFTVAVSKFKSISGMDSETETIEFKDGDDTVVRKKPGRTTYANITLEKGYSVFQNISEDIIQNIKFAAPEERKNLIEELKVNRKTLQTEILSMSLSTQENAKALREKFRENMWTTIGHVDHGKTAKIIVAHGKSLRMLNRYNSAIARFDHILGKIESRSEKIAQLYTKSSLNQREGGSEDDFGDAIDMSTVTLLIEEAKNMSVANKVKMEQLKAKYEELFLGENSQGIAKEARVIAKELKTKIQTLHDKLREITGEIKQAQKDYNESKSMPIKL